MMSVMPEADDTPDSELPPKERERQRHRDRKRETKMIVDNAGVRRLLPALRERSASRKRD